MTAVRFIPPHITKQTEEKLGCGHPVEAAVEGMFETAVGDWGGGVYGDEVDHGIYFILGLLHPTQNSSPQGST
jgi:hypothetical protein